MGAWPIAGLLLLSVVSGLACAALMILLGVQGVMVALQKRLEILQIGQENLDRRLTTEVKARAGAKGVEAARDARTLQQVASDRLLEEGRPAPTGRPSIISLVRR